MLQNKRKQQQMTQKREQAVDEMNQVLQKQLLSETLEANIAALQQLFQRNDTFTVREVQSVNNKHACYRVVFCQGMVAPEAIQENIVAPLQESQKQCTAQELADHVLRVGSASCTGSMQEIVGALCAGLTIVLLPQSDQAVLLDTVKYQTRTIEEPDSEKILSGPREGFCESLNINISLLQRKLQTHELKLQNTTIGQRTRTKVCVCYLDKLVNKRILAEVQRRLEKVEIDSVLDSNYLAEWIKDNRLSPFPTLGTTERPDVVASKLLEGRIAILVDGTPVALTAPYLFIENFQSCEDYYLNYYYTSFSRMLRILGFFLTICVPAFYIAIVAYHHEMLPTPFLINIASERKNVPFPAAVEAFVMLVIFDILRETGIRMPSNVGQALSIVGALVVGEAAVSAKLVASPMIIVIATTGITSLLIPKLSSAFIVVRLLLLVLATTLGLFGLLLGLSALLVHVLNLHSMGVPQLIPENRLCFQNVKDTFFRAPWPVMKKRAPYVAGNTRRSKGGDMIDTL